MKLLTLINPNARGGKSREELGDIENIYRKYGLESDFEITENQDAVFSLIQKTDLPAYSGIIAAGGDGSFFTLVNAVMKKNPLERISLGILPVGTGNSLAREFESPTEGIEEFVKIIADGKTSGIDLAKVETNEETFYFANMMGFGFITDVSATAAKLKMFGKLSYTLGVVYNTIKLNTFDLDIEIDGKKQIMDNVFVIVSNSRYTGGDYLIAPKAKINDGKLDLIILNRLSRLHLLQTFPKIFDGSHINTPYVDYIQAESILLKAKTPKVLSPDGEVYGHFPAKISVVPQALQVFGEVKGIVDK